MGKVTIDLGAIYNAATGGKGSVPKANKAFGAVADEDGFLRDKEGNLLPDDLQPYDGKTVNTKAPYQSPSWSTRVFFPEAAREQATANIAATQADDVARFAHERVLGLATSDAGEVQGVLGKQPSELTPRQIAILSGGNPNYSNMLGMADAAANQFQGIPVKTAQNASLGLDANVRQRAAYNLTRGPEDAGMAQAYSDYNTVTGEQHKAATRYPINVVDAANTGAQREVAFNKAEMPLIPKRAALADIGLNYDTAIKQNEVANLPAIIKAATNTINTDATLSGGRAEAAPNVASQLVDESKIAAGLSAGRASRMPALLATQGNEISNLARAAAYPAPAPNALYVTDQNTLARNPVFANIMDAMNAKFNKGSTTGSGMTTTPVGNGLNIVSNQPVLDVPKGIASATDTPTPVARPATQSWLDTQAQPNAPVSNTKIPVEGFNGYYMDMQGNLYDSSGSLISNPKQYHTNVLDAVQKQLNSIQDAAMAKSRISRASVYSNPEALAFPN